MNRAVSRSSYKIPAEETVHSASSVAYHQIPQDTGQLALEWLAGQLSYHHTQTLTMPLLLSPTLPPFSCYTHTYTACMSSPTYMYTLRLQTKILGKWLGSFVAMVSGRHQTENVNLC